MKTSKQEHISVQQIRDDLNGFVDNLARGKSYTILRRSRPVASVRGVKAAGSTTKFKPGSKEAVRESLKYAARARAQKKGVLDPDKSIKELYHEMLDEKYDIS